MSFQRLIKYIQIHVPMLFVEQTTIMSKSTATEEDLRMLDSAPEPMTSHARASKAKALMKAKATVDNFVVAMYGAGAKLQRSMVNADFVNRLASYISIVPFIHNFPHLSTFIHNSPQISTCVRISSPSSSFMHISPQISTPSTNFHHNQPH